MNYVLIRDNWEYVIAGECTAATYQRRGFEIAFCGSYSECKEYVQTH